MSKARELRRRIRSVQKTRQITRTMEMVAASKLKRATDRVRAARPYADQLAAVIARLASPELRERFPLLREPEEQRRVAVLALTSNRGLAGSFNSNLIRETRTLIQSLEADGQEVELHMVGKKGINFFRFKRREMASTHTDISDKPTTIDAANLVEPLLRRFADGGLDAVHVVYAQFHSAMSTPPAVTRVLPVDSSVTDTTASAADYILSPSAEEILDLLLPLYVRNSVYRSLVETAAAEQGARRTAMKSATDNAAEMIDRLRRSYNRARQGQITQEISEIVGGAAALE